MNVYDFDNTILRGDSSARFFAFCLRHYPKMWLDTPGQLINALLFGLHLKHKQEFKQRLFGFLRKIDDVDGAVAAFWEENYSRVKPWYPQKHRVSDVVISASPEFLIRPACERLGIKYVLASQVDKHTGRFSGKNCHGKEKVNRFRIAFPVACIENFYSDSYSDEPLAAMAKQAWIVKGERIVPWHET